MPRKLKEPVKAKKSGKVETLPKKPGTKMYGTGLRFQEWGIRADKTHPGFKIFEGPDKVIRLGELASAGSYISRGHRKVAVRLRRSASGKKLKNGVFQIALKHLENYELNLFRKGRWLEYRKNSKLNVLVDSLNGRKFPAYDIDALRKPTHIDYTNLPYVAGLLLREGYVLSPSTREMVHKAMQAFLLNPKKDSEEKFLLDRGEAFLPGVIVLFKEAKL